jgi:membrane-bound lytic murein transglycosylase D
LAEIQLFMKINKCFYSIFRLLGLALSLYSGSVAAADSTAVAVTYDPIVATLDSLLNQCYIQRLGTADIAAGNSREIPSYSDEVYRQRMDRIQTPIPLCFNDEVKQYIELYGIHKRALTERVIGLAQLYFPLYEEILDQQGLPLEFKYLSVVESALNPMAVSPVGATGLWQFMLSTGRLYGLKVTSYTDDRRDPVKSTYAACQYFKDMYAIYNDWLLVIAAYNCGAGNVNRAIARSGGKRTFWEISPYLPRETRGYVPAFIAVTYLMNHTAEHNLSGVAPLVNYFEVDTVLVNHKLGLRETAEATNVPYEVLAYLNPVYKKGLIPESEEPQVLRLPANRINSYLAQEAALMQPSLQSAVASLPATVSDSDPATSRQVTKYHRVRSGEHLQSIASKYRCSVSDLRRWNHLRSTRLRAGQSLKVYVYVPQKKAAPASAQVTPVVTQPSECETVPVDSVSGDPQPAAITFPTGVIYHVVAPGDTLTNIARRYEGLTVEKIKQTNRLESNDLKVGTRLKLEVGS